MITLEPTLSILDETDSGLDIDALKIVAEGVNKYRNSERSFYFNYSLSTNVKLHESRLCSCID